jgi:hypothetical protein
MAKQTLIEKLRKLALIESNKDEVRKHQHPAWKAADRLDEYEALLNVELRGVCPRRRTMNNRETGAGQTSPEVPCWASFLRHPILWPRWKRTARRVLATPGNQYVAFSAYLRGHR